MFYVCTDTELHVGNKKISQSDWSAPNSFREVLDLAPVRQCHRLPICFLTSDLTIRNKNKRTLIVRRTGLSSSGAPLHLSDVLLGSSIKNSCTGWYIYFVNNMGRYWGPYSAFWEHLILSLDTGQWEHSLGMGSTSGPPHLQKFNHGSNCTWVCRKGFQQKKLE